MKPTSSCLHHLVNRLFYFARFELTNHEGADVGLAEIPGDRNSSIACPSVSNADRAGAFRREVHHCVKASCVGSASQARHLNAHGPRFKQAVDQALCWLGKPDRDRQPDGCARFNDRPGFHLGNLSVLHVADHKVKASKREKVNHFGTGQLQKCPETSPLRQCQMKITMSHGYSSFSSAYAGDHGLGRGGMRNSGRRLSNVPLSCFGGFRCRADDPTKPWWFRTESFQRPLGVVG